MIDRPTDPPVLNTRDSQDSPTSLNERPHEKLTGILFPKGAAMTEMKAAMRRVRDEVQDRRAQGWLTREERTAGEERAAAFGKGGTR